MRMHDSHVHATAPCCARAVAQARPIMSCIQIVMIWLEGMREEWGQHLSGSNFSGSVQYSGL